MIGLLIVGVIVVFVLLPAISRIADRSAGQLIAQARVIASFGQSAFRSGGAFYRFSVYEQHLVVCFITARSYSYKDVRLVQEKYVQRGKLTVDRKRHLKAVSTSTLRVSKVMSITSSSGDHFDDRDRQCWKPQGAAELRA